MSDRQPIELEKNHAYPATTLYLDEAIWISAQAPDRNPLSPISGGGGPGFGGWGLDVGRPRGTGGPSRFARDPGMRRVFSEELTTVDKTYEELYASALQQLPAQITAEREAIAKQASEAGPALAKRLELQQRLTTAKLLERRAEYLQSVPVATSFYGAVPFYKRYDSFATRLTDKGAFELGDSGEAWGRKVWTTYNNSVDAAHRLHIAAEKSQALASELAALAHQLDQAELEQTPVDLGQVISRRIEQIQKELQICFACLPNFLQHQVFESTQIQEENSLAQTLSAYANATSALTAAKQAAVPHFTKSNPNIRGPLSKPQVEALQHLVDEQSTKRAGPLWAEYHSALSLNESIRYLQWFSGVLANLQQRAAEVERLNAEHQAELSAAEAARQQSETERNRSRYSVSTTVAAAMPVVIPVGAASFAIAQASYEALQAAIRTAITARIAALSSVSLPALVGTVAMLWPSTLGNAERRYLTSIPLADLSPPEGPDLAAMAASAQALDLPYLLAGVEEEERLDLYVVPGDKPVPIRAATFDSERQVYSLALDSPQRILTWTPASAPGTEEGNSTSLPSAPPGTIIYSGSSLDPVNNELEGYPAPDLLDQERLIVTFPIDSGLPPILVVFKSPRYEPGTSTGFGQAPVGALSEAAAVGEGAPIPADIADLLRGMEFKTFNGFRRQFWKAMANHPELSKQFDERSLRRMRGQGYAPTVDDSEIHISQISYVLHHTVPISEGGGVYDMNNIRIVTPRLHNHIHYGGDK